MCRSCRSPLAGFAVLAVLTASTSTHGTGTGPQTRAVRVEVEIPAPRVDAGYVPPRALRIRERHAVADAEVVVVLPSGDLASGRTDANGVIRIPEGWLGGELLVVARTARKAAVSVDDCPFAGCAHGRNLWAASVLLTADVVDHGQIVVPAESPAAGAFAILSAAAAAELTATAAGVPPGAPIAFRWLPGSTTACATTCFVAGSEPHIPVLGLDSDSDHFDEQILMHEYGHFVESQIAGDAGPGGYHDGTPTDPALALSEGFATWFAVAASADANYVDSHRDGAAWYAYGGLTARGDEAADLRQPVSEDLVVELLLRLAPSGDTAAQRRLLDAVRAAHADHAAGGTCGADGVDLADVLRAMSVDDPAPIADAAHVHGFPWSAERCAAPAPAVPGTPVPPPQQSPITAAAVEVRCDEDAGGIVVLATARAALADATVVLRRVDSDGEIAAAVIHDVGPIPPGDAWRVDLGGPWRQGLVAARLDWFLDGGSRGVNVATASCDLPDPGAWTWAASELRTLSSGLRLRVASARGLR